MSLIYGCKDETEVPPETTSFQDGIFIVNEGPFGTGTGSITFLARDASLLEHKIYQKANFLEPLGNIVHSMTVIGDKAYIAVNNASKVEIVNSKTFSKFQTLPNINYPAYILEAGDNKVYISSWEGKIFIVSKDGTESFGMIPVGTGPEKMIKIDGNIWVLNQGGLSVDSTISIIDPDIDQVIQTLDVYPRPTGIRQDAVGKVWVLCSGKGFWQSGATRGHLVSIDPVGYSIIDDIVFPDTLNHPEELEINNTGNTLFYNYPGGIYRFETNSQSLDQVPFVPR
jgi:streptogramin lyase